MDANSKGNSRRLYFLVFILLIVTPGKINVQVKKEMFVRSNYSFIAEHWAEKKLQQLRERENYKDLKTTHQFDFFLQLCNWVHNQWQRSVPDPYPLNNAIDILDDIRSKKTGGFCGQYSFVLADVLKSLGFFNVRYAELWSNQGRSHFVVEVWSDRYEKWLILDADYNIYYEMVESGIPANALEIRASLFDGAKVIARSATKINKVAEGLQKDLYANFAVSMRSDLIRNTKPLTVTDRFNTFLFYLDDCTNHTFFGQKIPYRNITTRPGDVYYDCNFVRINHTLDKGGNSVSINFSTDSSMPHFKSFVVRTNQGQWQHITGDSFVLKPEQSPHRLDVAAVNMFNRMGCINTLVVNF